MGGDGVCRDLSPLTAVCEGFSHRNRQSNSLLLMNGIQNPVRHVHPASPRSVNRSRFSVPRCEVGAALLRRGLEYEILRGEIRKCLGVIDLGDALARMTAKFACDECSSELHHKRSRYLQVFLAKFTRQMNSPNAGYHN